MHSQLIYMGLEEGTIIKDIQYVHLHVPKYLHEIM